MLSIIPATDAATWDFAVSTLPHDLRDVHLSSAWARAHAIPGVREGFLATWMNEKLKFIVCQAFMLRTIGDTGYRDMITIGYGGPFSGAALSSPIDVIPFEEAMAAWRKENRVVSEFYLLNPVYNAHQWVLLPQEPSYVERNVYLVHLGSDEEIEARMRPTRLQSMNKVKDPLLYPLLGPDAFHALYDPAMTRLDAAGRWRFPVEYFRRAQMELQPGEHIAFLGMGDKQRVMAAAMFVRGTTVAYYHLACTAADRVGGYADLVLAAGMSSARAAGCDWMHLGGGLHSRDGDTLDTYKRSFGGIPRMVFSVRRVHDQAKYDELSVGAPEGWFPAYRYKEANPS